MLLKNHKIFLAGHNGMVGSAIYRALIENGYNNVFTIERSDLDLTRQNETEEFFNSNNFDYVFLAAAKVGGINANDIFSADFIFENTMIQNNVINSAHKNKINNLLLLGSSCIYPRMAQQPLKEEYLMTGHLEPTNEAYAISKINGIKTCEAYNKQYSTDYRCVMPTNLYGPGDNFNVENSHVIPALMHKAHLAKCNNDNVLKIWGTGQAFRDFLYVDDMARACLHIAELDKSKIYEIVSPTMSHINIGSGLEIEINELAKKICKIVGFNGDLIFDKSKPTGTPKKILNTDIINKLGWTPKINLNDGLVLTYEWFKENESNIRL